MDTKALNLYLLGRPLIELGGEPVDGFVSEKVLMLLGYLAVQAAAKPGGFAAEGSLARERLAGLFWGDMPDRRAKANLRMAVYNLQQLLPGYLQAARLSVAFNRQSDYWLDVEQFEILLAADPQSSPHSIQQLEVALALYRGEFMQGIHLGSSTELEEWLLVERERLRQLALEGFQRYAAALMDSGQYIQAVQALRRLLRLEPWQESAHQQLMLALARSGDYTAALAQYEACRRLLADELSVDPMPETTQLYERIRAARDLPFRHNLPTPPTPFIGREAALQELTRLLSNPSRRLVTITGPGGAGKSRLALQAAAGLIDAFLHGAYLVPLASLTSAEHLSLAVGGALGFQFSGMEDPQLQLLRYLQEKELLLVLDNCEHLAGAANFVNEVLRTTSQVKILATSRERLDLMEEWLYELGGLEYPANATDQTWSDYAALRLFVDSAHRLQRGYDPTPSDLLDIWHICQLVEGLPLGIELAAACIRHYSCRDIATEIERSIDILAATWHNVPRRHRSLRAAFDHSWRLLSYEAQQALRQVAVFRGGFTPQAARQVAGCSLEILHILVNRSLLRWSALYEESRRFDLHELLRQYAYEQLAEAEEEQATRTRHLDFFLDLAETARAGLDGADAPAWMERLEAELDNFRAALDWSLLNEESLLAGLRLASALAEFWGRKGYLSEGHTRLEALLARMDANLNAGDRIQEYWHALGLCAAGDMALLQGSLAEAQARFQAGLSLGQALGEQAIAAAALLGSGTTAWTQSNFGFAQDCFEESLRLYRARGDTHGSAVALRRLGHALRIQGHYAQAVDCYQQSRDLYRKTGDQRGIAQISESLGVLARVQGDLGQAQSLAEKSLALRRTLGDTHGISFSLFNLGAVAYERGDAQQARAYLEESLATRRRLGDQVGAAAALNVLGDVALDEGNAQQARRLLKESLSQRRLLGEKYGMIDDLRGLGKVYLQLDDPSQARSSLEEALASARELGVGRIIGAVLRDLADLFLRIGDEEQSLALLQESLSLSSQHDDWRGVVESLEALAELSARQSHPQLAARLLGSAAGLRSSTGPRRTPREQAAAVRRVKAIRICLEQAQFDRAWEEGRHLSGSQAIELALQAANRN
jgi:predicted ATPase/DNA-binding SARP family transcriptional activator/Tfp pilus assembly protein PilF